MFGFCATKQLHWAVGYVGFGFIGVGLTNGASLSLTYVIDSYYPVADEAMLAVNATKNVVAFGVLYGVAPWVAQSGYQHVSCLRHRIRSPNELSADHFLSETGFWSSHRYLPGGTGASCCLLFLRRQDSTLHFQEFQAHLLACWQVSMKVERQWNGSKDFCCHFRVQGKVICF